MTTNGSFYWNELMTRDAEKAKQFYGATLGWTFEAMDQGDGGAYWLAKVGDETVAGIFTLSGPDYEGAEEGWFAYIAVNDLSTALARATTAGGEVVREPWDVPGVGRIAIVADSSGVMTGWMTPSEQA
jgi:predicted enzyme related to lactoylglutathione lyase